MSQPVAGWFRDDFNFNQHHISASIRRITSMSTCGFDADPFDPPRFESKTREMAGRIAA